MAEAQRKAPVMVFRCPRCDHEQESDREPDRCPVCNFHGMPDGRWIMQLRPYGR